MKRTYSEHMDIILTLLIILLRRGTIGIISSTENETTAGTATTAAAEGEQGEVN